MWGKNLVDSALQAAGTDVGNVGIEALENASVLYNGMSILTEGAIITRTIGAIAVYVIDHKLSMPLSMLWPAVYVLSLVLLMPRL